MSEVNKSTLQNSMKAVYNITPPPATVTHNESFVGIKVIKKVETDKPVQIESEIPVYDGENVQEVILNARNTQTSRDDVLVSIGTPVGLCMKAIYNIEEPDKLTVELPSDMDSYTRSDPPHHIDNYGHTTSMHITSGEYPRNSLVYFQLPLWFEEVVSIKTRLRLYVRGSFTGKENITLHTAERKWREYGVTSANEPRIKATITSDYIYNKEEGYIEFDVMSVVDKWKLFPEENFGFILTTTEEQTIKFYTRETQYPPLLVGEYFDPKIKSFDRSNKPVDLMVVEGGEDDVLVEIEPETEFGHSDALVDIMPYTYGDTIFSDREVQIVSTKKKINVDLAVARLAEDETPAEVSVRQQTHDNFNGEITVSRPQEEVQIRVSYSDYSEVPVIIKPKVEDVDREVQIQPIVKNNTNVDLMVSNREKPVELYVYDNDDKDVRLSVNHKFNKDVELMVNRPEEHVELFVYFNEDKEAQIHAKGWEKSSASTEITVSRPQANVDLIVEYADDTEVVISARGKVHDDQDTIIRVSTPEKYVQLVTKAILDDMEAVIDVYQRAEKEAESLIHVTHPEKQAQIGVYFKEVSEPFVQIRPMVRRTNNVPIQLFVRNGVVGYAFIM